MYSWIATYNTFLQTLNSYSGSDVSATVKSTYEAEVRLLRAMAYFNLYKFYGSVPLVITPLTVASQYVSKADNTAVLAQINADIDFAVANLPDQQYSNTNGHLVKSSAEVLKARVLLFDAYDNNGNAITGTLSQVESVTSDIINKNYYSIAPSFRGLFCQDLGQQNGNPEFIFSVNYSAPNDCETSIYGWGQAQIYTYDAGAPGGAVTPLANLANEFEFTDGSSFSVTNPLYDLNNVYKNRDPRMVKTMFTDSVIMEDGSVLKTLVPGSPTGYSYWKHIEAADQKNIYGSVNGSDWPSMRYAEVLLMYAESANEVDGPTAAVYNAINQIRSRADINMPNLPAGLSKDLMRAAIRNERRVELAFEGFRYDDLKRWKVATQVLNMPASASIIPKTFLPINYHLPLPQSAITVNHALVQNPDY